MTDRLERTRNVLADYAAKIEDEQRRWDTLFRRLQIPQDMSFSEKFDVAALRLIHQQPEFRRPRKRGPKPGKASIDELRAIFVKGFRNRNPDSTIRDAIKAGKVQFRELFPSAGYSSIEKSVYRGKRKLGLSW